MNWRIESWTVYKGGVDWESMRQARKINAQVEDKRLDKWVYTIVTEACEAVTGVKGRTERRLLSNGR